MSNWIFRVFCVASAIVFFQCAARKTQTSLNNASTVPDAQVSEPQPVQLEKGTIKEPEPLPAEMQKRLEVAESIEHGATQYWLNQGKEILNLQCGSCHKPKNPLNYDEASWVKHMNRMVTKSKLTEDQTKYLRVYTLTLIRTGS
ncbi:MAG: hypothetical protein ACK5FT_00385 [Sphingomonadales bacterium]|jgi:cytochrome c5